VVQRQTLPVRSEECVGGKPAASSGEALALEVRMKSPDEERSLTKRSPLYQ